MNSQAELPLMRKISMINKRLRVFGFAVLSAFVFASLSLSAQTPPSPRTIQLDDFVKIASVSDPQISPDGKSIAFVVSHPNLEQDRSDRELLVIDIASGAPRALTHDRKGVGSPRWSPSGTASGRDRGTT